MIRAKFVCQSKTVSLQSVWNPETQKSETKPVHSFKFYPITGKDGENEKFFASTPTGQLDIGVVRDDLFELGKAYYLDFIPAE